MMRNSLKQRLADDWRLISILRAAQALCGLLFAFLLAEAALRSFVPASPPLNASSLYYENHRGYYEQVALEGARPVYGIRYNSTREGFRLPDGPGGGSGRAAAGRGGILLLGDSFTYGRGVRYGDTCAARLEKLLSAEGAGAPVFNAGVVGAGVEEVERAYLLLSRELKPRLVVYGLVLNDFGARPPEGAASDLIDGNNAAGRRGRFAHSRALGLVSEILGRRSLTRRTLRAYRDSFTGPGAAEKFAAIARLNSRVAADGGRLAVMVYPLLYELKEYPLYSAHEAVLSFCAAEDIPCLDLLPVFSRYGEERLQAAPSDQHPNELAQGVAAAELAAFLRREGLIAAGAPARPLTAAYPEAPRQGYLIQ